MAKFGLAKVGFAKVGLAKVGLSKKVALSSRQGWPLQGVGIVPLVWLEVVAALEVPEWWTIALEVLPSSITERSALVSISVLIETVRLRSLSRPSRRRAVRVFRPVVPRKTGWMCLANEVRTNLSMGELVPVEAEIN